MGFGSYISKKWQRIVYARGFKSRIAAACVLCFVALAPTVAALMSITAVAQDQLPMPAGITTPVDSVAEAEILVRMGDKPIEVEMPDSVQSQVPDSALVEVTAAGYSPEYGLRRPFNPEPGRAVWLSALLPGLGQIYNRRYWKLPIIVGGFMGLGYATSWNNTQLSDYTRAYRDLMDNDPSTKSYMDFFPPTTSEGDLDKSWLQNTLRSRKDFYRRNRDLCIICMAALYLLCMLDAYVDASLAHFDISPDLSMDLQPAMFLSPTDRKPALGLNWAFTF